MLNKTITYKVLLLLFLITLMLNGFSVTCTSYIVSEAVLPLNSFTNWWGTSYLLLFGSVICKYSNTLALLDSKLLLNCPILKCVLNASS